MVATGIPLFLSEAVKCYFSDAFWVKMAALGLALVFTFGVRNRLIDERTGSEDVFEYKGGISAFVNHLNRKKHSYITAFFTRK